jgi:hypothetical protein
MNRRPLITGALGMGLFEALGLKPASAKPEPQAAPSKPGWPQGALAQLVGANAISSMFAPRYCLERHLPLLLEPGPDGKPPKSYKTVGGGSGKFNPVGRARADREYLRTLSGSFQFVVSYYGRDVEGYNLFMWNGVRMNGLQVVGGFTAERTDHEARELWATAYRQYGLTSEPVLTLASGNAGWTTLEAGWKLIASPEAKVIWQATVDSPSYPKDEEPNEAAVLLMVAHPAYDTGRKPLAYFSAPAVVPVKDVKREEGESPRVAALRLAVQQVCATADIEPNSIGSIASDCGRNTPAASKRLSEVAAALHGLVHDLDVVHQRIDMVALLGELGANTVNYSLLLAAYAAYQRNHVVLYVSNVDPDAGRAMLVFPPRDHTQPDPHREFPTHDAGQWYAPWWGQRLDGKKDF